MKETKKDTKTQILEATWHLLEKSNGQEVTMGDVAKAVGISRQAVYLHFSSRTELMIATSNYVDEIKGLYDRLDQLINATSGYEILEIFIDVWGNHIPEIYVLAKALMRTREIDEAAAAVWDENMRCLRDVCNMAIDTLEKEGNLNSEWSNKAEAVDMFMTIISFASWEQLTIEYGWPQDQYIDYITSVAKQLFVSANK